MAKQLIEGNREPLQGCLWRKIDHTLDVVCRTAASSRMKFFAHPAARSNERDPIAAQADRPRRMAAFSVFRMECRQPRNDLPHSRGVPSLEHNPPEFSVELERIRCRPWARDIDVTRPSTASVQPIDRRGASPRDADYIIIAAGCHQTLPDRCWCRAPRSELSSSGRNCGPLIRDRHGNLQMGRSQPWPPPRSTSASDELAVVHSRYSQLAGLKIVVVCSRTGRRTCPVSSAQAVRRAGRCRISSRSGDCKCSSTAVIDVVPRFTACSSLSVANSIPPSTLVWG